MRTLSRLLIPAAALTVLLVWLWLTPPGLLGKADALGYAVCHRIDERSFHFDDGRQTPLCARCSGMYLGAVLGLIFLQWTNPRRSGFPRREVWIPLAVFAAAFAFDGANSYFYLMKSVIPGRLDWIPTFYLPNNTLRLFTGSGMGLGIAALLYPAFNQSVWRQAPASPILSGWKQPALLLALMAAADLLVLTDWDIIIAPLATISAGGVLAVLTLVYTLAWLMLMRQENAFDTWGELGLPLLAGMTIALLQVTAIDLFRLWLTGTWGAFPLK